MRARYFAVFFLLLAFLSTGFSACVNLSDSSTWTQGGTTYVANYSNTFVILEDTTLCKDIYSIDPEDDSPAIAFDSDDLTLDCNGSTIVNPHGGTDYGVIIDVAGAKLKNCIISSYNTNIYVDGDNGGVRGTLVNITLRDSNSELLLYGDDFNISGLSIPSTHADTAIEIDGSNNILSNVNETGAGFCGVFVRGHNNQVKNSNFIENIDTDVCVNSCDVLFENITVTDNSPLIYYANTDVSLSGLDGVEILLCNVSGFIANSSLSSSYLNDGLYLLSSRDVVIKNISADGVGYGLMAQNVQNITLEKSNFSNVYDGVFVLDSIYVYIYNVSTLHADDAGVYFDTVNSSYIEDSNFSDSSNKGPANIYLYKSYYNYINNVSACGGNGGFLFDESSWNHGGYNGGFVDDYGNPQNLRFASSATCPGTTPEPVPGPVNLSDSNTWLDLVTDKGGGLLGIHGSLNLSKGDYSGNNIEIMTFGIHFNGNNSFLGTVTDTKGENELFNFTATKLSLDPSRPGEYIHDIKISSGQGILLDVLSESESGINHLEDVYVIGQDCFESVCDLMRVRDYGGGVMPWYIQNVVLEKNTSSAGDYGVEFTSIDGAQYHISNVTLKNALLRLGATHGFVPSNFYTNAVNLVLENFTFINSGIWALASTNNILLNPQFTISSSMSNLFDVDQARLKVINTTIDASNISQKIFNVDSDASLAIEFGAFSNIPTAIVTGGNITLNGLITVQNISNFIYAWYHAVIDPYDATLVGDGSGIGILVNNTNTTILRMNITNFSYGIYLANASNTFINDSALCGNTIAGLYIDNNTANVTGEHNYGNMSDKGVNNTVEMLDCSLIPPPPTPCVNLSDSSTWGTAVSKSGDTYYINGSVTLCRGDYSIPVDSAYTEAIKISDNNVVLDCNGSRIIGKGINPNKNGIFGGGSTDRGIAIHVASNSVIKNCNISGYSFGVYVPDGLNNVTVTNSTFYNNSEGISFDLNASNFTISSNHFYNNVHSILYAIPSTSDKSDECYDIHIYNNTGYNGNPIFYSSNASVNVTNGVYAELIFCGNDNISIENVTIQSSNGAFSSDGIFMTFANNTHIKNVTLNNTRVGAQSFYGGHSFQMERTVINSTNLIYGVYAYTNNTGSNNFGYIKDSIIFAPNISNTFMSSYSGLAGILLGFTNTTIINNTVFFGNVYYGGIYVSSNHSMIANNTVSSVSPVSVCSIHVANNSYIYNNQLNYVNGTGICVDASFNNISIFKNVLSYTYGLGMNISADNVNISNNSLNYSNGFAILLEHNTSSFQPGTNYLLLFNNISFASGSGIMISGNYITMSNNSIIAINITTPSILSGWPSFASFFMSSQNSTISNNLIRANYTDFSTLFLQNLINSSIINNTIIVNDGPLGIYFDTGMGGVIKGNTIINASYGAYLRGVSFYSIFNNNITSKDTAMILGTSSSTSYNSTSNNISYNNLCEASTIGLYLDENTTNNRGISNYGNMTDNGANNTVEMLNCSSLPAPSNQSNQTPPIPPSQSKKHKKPLSLDYTLKNSSLMVHVTSEGKDIYDAHVTVREITKFSNLNFYVKTKKTDDNGEAIFSLPYPAKYYIKATKSGYETAQTTFTYATQEKPEEPKYSLKLSWNYDTERATLSIYTKLYKNNKTIDPSNANIKIKGKNLTYTGHPDSKGKISLIINQSGNYTIKANYKEAKTQKIAEIILPTKSTSGESEGSLVVNVNKPSIIIEAPASGFVGESLTIYVTYTNRTPAANVQIKAISHGREWELTTNNKGEATFTPPQAGIYSYSSDLPIKQTATTEVKIKHVEEEQQETYKKAVDLNVESNAIIYVKPKVKGEYTAKVYLDNKLITERAANGTLTLKNLPSGHYRIVVIANKNVKGLDVEVANKNILGKLSSFELAGVVLIVILIIAAIYILIRHKSHPSVQPSSGF